MTILNPGYSDFKEYTGLTGKDSEHLHKRHNFLLFSIYENDNDNKMYLAALMNFIEITHNTNNTESTVTKDSATTTVVDTTRLTRIDSLIEKK
jgi:hypothetical protein